MAVVVGLVLVAAALSALSAAGEQRAASRLARRPRSRARAPGSVPDTDTGSRRRIRLWVGLAGSAAGFALALLSTPLWLGSWLVDATSFFAEATALHFGSLSVVEPLMVSTLLFSLPLAALGTGRRLTVRDWAGAGAICLGLALVLGTRTVPSAESARQGTLVPAMMGVLAVAAVLVALSRGRSPALRAGLLSVAAGALFGVGAALTKLTAGVVATGELGRLLTSWPGYLLAAVSLCSFALQQAAYASGPLASAMTAVVIVNPLTSYLLGVVGFGEPMPHLGGPLVLTVLGMAVLSVGVAVLARSPLLQPYTTSDRRRETEPSPARTVGESGTGEDGTGDTRSETALVCCAAGSADRRPDRDGQLSRSARSESDCRPPRSTAPR